MTPPPSGRRLPDILFDLAGVLVRWDPRPLYLELFRGDAAAVEVFFNDILNEDKQREIGRGRRVREVLAELEEQHPDYAEPLRAWWGRWDEMVSGPIEGTLGILRELRTMGHRACLLGNWSREEIDRARARFGFLSELDGVVISGDHGVMKPSPEIFEIASRDLGLTPRSTVFIDDSPENVKAAQELGFDAIRFRSPVQLRLNLRERGLALGD